MDTVIADFEMFLKIKLDERYKYTKGSIIPPDGCVTAMSGKQQGNLAMDTPARLQYCWLGLILYVGQLQKMGEKRRRPNLARWKDQGLYWREVCSRCYLCILAEQYIILWVKYEVLKIKVCRGYVSCYYRKGIKNFKTTTNVSTYLMLDKFQWYDFWEFAALITNFEIVSLLVFCFGNTYYLQWIGRQLGVLWQKLGYIWVYSTGVQVS